MALATQIGGGAPAGALVSIPLNITGPAAVGDLVLAQVGWAASGLTNQLGTFTDALGNVWNVVPMSNNTGQTGGLAWTIVTVPWAANTATATLTGGVPGGRVYLVLGVPAAQLAATPFDQHVAGTLQTTATPSTSTGVLATAASLVFAADLQRAGAGTAALGWSAGWTPDGSETGGATPASGIFLAEQSVSSTAPVTASGTSVQGTDRHQLDVIVFKLASAPPPPTVPVGTPRVRPGKRLVDVGQLAA